MVEANWISPIRQTYVFNVMAVPYVVVIPFKKRGIS
jgi:hypothetical protein